MIGKNRWRVPEGKKEGGGGGEGGGGRSEEDMALEREAAAAVLKGQHYSLTATTYNDYYSDHLWATKEWS